MIFQLTIDNQDKFRFSLFHEYGTRLYCAFNTSILLEYHLNDCKCSYCSEKLSGIGFKRPECKAPNSWRRFYLRRRSGIWYLRFTLPEWLCRRTSRGEKVAARLMGKEVKNWK